jgi:hypothetical protein
VTFRSFFDQFDQNAAGRFRVQERYAAVVSAESGFFVDGLDARLGEPRESGRQVGNTVGDVMEARAAPSEEASDCRVGPERLDQLDARSALAEENDIDTLRFDAFARGTARAGQGFEKRQRFIE